MIAQATFGVVELRRYAMQPGKRDDLIALFERSFIETQEADGMVPIGHFHDRNDADAFVWLRGFPSMEARREALERFYGSPTWLKNSDAANATLADTDNVLLLRSARPESGFDVHGLTRPARAAVTVEPPSTVAVSIFMLDEPAGDDVLDAFEAELLPRLRRVGGRVSRLVTEQRPNDFRHPVREGEYALVVTGVCATRDAFETWSHYADQPLPEAMRAHVIGTETLDLTPAPRSLLR